MELVYLFIKEATPFKWNICAISEELYCNVELCRELKKDLLAQEMKFPNHMHYYEKGETTVKYHVEYIFKNGNWDRKSWFAMVYLSSKHDKKTAWKLIP